jgi:hypothetical protein
MPCMIVPFTPSEGEDTSTDEYISDFWTVMGGKERAANKLAYFHLVLQSGVPRYEAFKIADNVGDPIPEGESCPDA